MPERPRRAANAGGFLIAAGALGGVAIGLVVGEPTLGLLVGFGVSAALATLLWLEQRRG